MSHLHMHMHDRRAARATGALAAMEAKAPTSGRAGTVSDRQPVHGFSGGASEFASGAGPAFMRRLRIVSEPVTDYIKFEWLDTEQLVGAGEDVRWLPRRRASTLLLPGNDFWLFDGETVVFTHFSGDGKVLGYHLTRDPDVVRQCMAAFDEAWPRAIPHSEYTPT